MTILLGVDIGQTKSKYLAKSSGRKLLEMEFEGLTHSSKNFTAELINQISHVIADLETSEISLAVGLTYLPQPSEVTQFMKLALAQGPISKIAVFGDEFSSQIGAMGLDPGVVMAVGTGISCSSLSLNSGFQTFGGYGYLLSDEGSGYWLGRAGLAAAVKAKEGSGPTTKLTDLIDDNYPDLETFIDQIYRSDTPSKLIASFAKSVIELSKSDAVAKDIVLQACNLISEQIVNALTGSSTSNFTLIGGVVNDADMRETIIESVKKTSPKFHYKVPLGNALEGCILIADKITEIQRLNEGWQNKPMFYSSFQ
jgi:glucosamine kinase